MPELIYPTSTKILGPILIDTASLMELDRILGEQECPSFSDGGRPVAAALSAVESVPHANGNGVAAVHKGS